MNARLVRMKNKVSLAQMSLAKQRLFWATMVVCPVAAVVFGRVVFDWALAKALGVEG